MRGTAGKTNLWVSFLGVGKKSVGLLERCLKKNLLVCSNVGSPISSKRITDTLISPGRKISGNTVERYLNALCDAFIFYEVPRFDIRGNETLKTLGKYYLADTGLRNILIGSRTDDFGHMLENLVYLELKRRGNQVYVGKARDAEIDFVTKKGEMIEYYQVSASILDENTRKRELDAGNVGAHPRHKRSVIKMRNHLSYRPFCLFLPNPHGHFVYATVCPCKVWNPGQFYTFSFSFCIR